MNIDPVVINVQHYPNPHDLLTEAIDRIGKAWFAAAKAGKVTHDLCIEVVAKLCKAVEQPNVFDALAEVQAVVDQYGIPAKGETVEAVG